MTREKPLHVQVENKSDDVPCPECNEKMRKDTYPGFPMYVHGLVGCDNADCSVHEEQKLVSWSYRTGEVAFRVTPVPKAREDDVFQNSPPDKEPDGESES